MKAVLRLWDRYWFTPEGPTNLGFCRALYCGLVLAFYAGIDLSPWGAIPDAFWVPSGFFASFGIPVASEKALAGLQAVWKLALGLACVGLFTRWSLAVALVLGLYLLGLFQNFGKVGHGEAIVPLVLAVLVCSRCGDAWSLDALLRRRRADPASGSSERPASGHYRWPVRAVWLIVSLILMSAGLAKLENSGTGWISSENMTVLLVQHHYYYGGAAPTGWGLAIARLPVVTFLLALGTVALELGVVLAMFDWRLRLLIVPSAFGMLAGFALLLGPFFVFLMGAFVFWVPWDALGRWLLQTGPEAT